MDFCANVIYECPPLKCDFFGQMAPKPLTIVQYVTRRHIMKWKNAVVISDQIGNDYALDFHHCICAWNFLVSAYNPFSNFLKFLFSIWKIATYFHLCSKNKDALRKYQKGAILEFEKPSYNIVLHAFLNRMQKTLVLTSANLL